MKYIVEHSRGTSEVHADSFDIQLGETLVFYVTTAAEVLQRYNNSSPNILVYNTTQNYDQRTRVAAFAGGEWKIVTEVDETDEEH